MQAIALARAEMKTIVAKQKVDMALKRKLPPAAKQVIKKCSKILIYQEKEKQWASPVIAEVDGKTVRVYDHRGVLKPFSILL
eukprot:IDg3593t1